MVVCTRCVVDRSTLNRMAAISEVKIFHIWLNVILSILTFIDEERPGYFLQGVTWRIHDFGDYTLLEKKDDKWDLAHCFIFIFYLSRYSRILIIRTVTSFIWCSASTSDDRAVFASPMQCSYVNHIGESRQPWVGVCLGAIRFFQKVWKEKSWIFYMKLRKWFR